MILADWNEKEVQAAAKDSPIQVTRHWPSAVMCRMTPRWEAMVKETVATFGRLDAAYNNAGVQDLLAETAASPCDDYDRIMDKPCSKAKLMQPGSPYHFKELVRATKK